MRTSELILAMKKRGYTCEDDGRRVMFLKDDQYVAMVRKDMFGILDTNWCVNRNWHPSLTEGALRLLVEYGMTPVEEREDEPKRYRLRADIPALTRKESYLNRAGNNDFFIASGNNSLSFQTIFTEEELKDIDETGFVREPVEDSE